MISNRYMQPIKSLFALSSKPKSLGSVNTHWKNMYIPFIPFFIARFTPTINNLSSVLHNQYFLKNSILNMSFPIFQLLFDEFISNDF